MNLIDQQTAAKELPMQYLQQAVNGQNPNLTPWIATAELQRRTTMNQHMQAAQKPQGPQPTVKDQIEQKAGLMATQAAQQQQAQAQFAQQSMQPKAPVPEATPQPEPQPEEPLMAARGGLMNAPVNFQFAHGGILGYAGGGDTNPEAEQLASDRKAVEEGLKKFGYAAADIAAMPFRAASALLNTLIVRPTRAVTGAEVPYFPMMGGGDNSSITPYTDRAYQETQAAAPKPAAPKPAVNDRAPLPSLQGQGIKDALPKPPAPPPGAQRPLAPPPGAQRPSASPMQKPPAMGAEEQIAADYTKSATPQASMQTAIGNEQQLAKAYNLDQPMGTAQETQQARQDEAQQRQQEQAKKLAWSAFVQGTVGTPGSGSLAYDQTMANAMGREAEYGQSKYKNIADLETARRTAQEKRAGIAGTDYGKQQEAQAAALKDKATVAAQMFNISSQAASSAAQNMTSLEIAHIHAAAMNRPGEAERIMATAIGLKATDPAKYATFMETLSAVKGAGKPDQNAAIADKAYDNVTSMMKGNPMLSIKYSKDPAAFQAAVEAETTRLRGSAGVSTGSTRLKFDAQGNQIK